jgi:hypothetical protein
LKSKEDGVETTPIHINILKMDNRGKPEVLDGEPIVVDTDILRQNNGMPITMQLTRRTEGFREEELKFTEEETKLIKSINKEDKVDGEIQITATFCFFSTPYVREPVGFVTLKNIQIFNHDHFCDAPELAKSTF